MRTYIRKIAILAFFAAVPFMGAAAATAAENAAGQSTKTSDPLQLARGAQQWVNNCGNCHNLRSPKEFSDKNWDVIVNHMQTIAPLPGQVARDIKAFLKNSN